MFGTGTGTGVGVGTGVATRTASRVKSDGAWPLRPSSSGTRQIQSEPGTRDSVIVDLNRLESECTLPDNPFEMERLARIPIPPTFSFALVRRTQG